MSDAYAVFVEGLDLGASISEISPAIVRAARASINSTAAMGRTLAATEIGRQINFPAGYLSPANGRLVVGKQATADSLEANITARTRPTSLARFLPPGAAPGTKGVTVAVKPGAAKFLGRAFLIKLRAGNDPGATNGNIGLAIRTNGSPPTGAYKPLQLAPNLYLLYGPSVDQVFKGAEDGSRGARDVIAPVLENYLVDEFNRLLDVSL